ncbi:VanW family protein [Peptostreptococcus equinus]|uniref:VanW family protein n=1 Tax=Peptostreptococcus equinus TaxID=3003601 RepID=A0ABY7JPU8_9FIRM|nr:VanW family protein [Peptostreptococcus sp. CBA3647]WAW13995.1 VanW family protein [Peptostreptococcus sp. CBA3647]
MSFLRKNKKAVISISVVAILLIGLISVPSIQMSSNKIANNVMVSDINIGGLTKNQAIKKLENNNKFSNIKLKFENKKWTINKDKLALNYNIKETVNQAYLYNRKGGFFSNIFNTLKSDFGSKNKIELVKSYDVNMLKAEIQSIKKGLDSPVKNATMSFENDKAVVNDSIPGREVNLDKSLKMAQESIKNDTFTSTLEVKLEKAKFNKEDLKGIDARLSTYKTRFGGMEGRDYNIKKSTIESGEILLKPGEEYSFNKITGEKTLERGYRTAPVIESGQLVPGIGGGVCQTTSTIFNTALLSGMQITDRRSHTIPSDYVDMGRDSTVFDGDPGQDLKFKNPFKHPVYIKNFIQGNYIVSEIYGSKEDIQTIDIVTEMLGSYGGGNKTIKDPSLPAGAKVVEKYSRPGYNMMTYRIYKDKNGNTIRTEKIGPSHYPAQTGVIRVGAGTTKSPSKQNPADKSSNKKPSTNSTQIQSQNQVMPNN